MIDNGMYSALVVHTHTRAHTQTHTHSSSSKTARESSVPHFVCYEFANMPHYDTLNLILSTRMSQSGYLKPCELRLRSTSIIRFAIRSARGRSLMKLLSFFFSKQKKKYKVYLFSMTLVWFCIHKT